MKDIVLLHGAIGASDQLEPLAGELNKLGFRTHSMDFSGHGMKSFTNGFGIEAFSVELAQFINHNRLIKPHIFGYSMGGYVALYVASKQPELLGKIVTLGTKFDWSPEISVKEIKMLDAKTILEKVPKFAEALQRRHGDKWELLLKKTAQMMLDLGENNLLNSKKLSAIQNKCYIGLADLDTMVSVNETDDTAAKIKNAERYSLINAKHPIESVNAVELSRLVNQFCS